MEPRTIRIPFRLIDQQYGADNVDNAGDDVANLLVELSDYPDQYRYAFDEDLAHANPYFHSLVFSVYDIPDSLFTTLRERIANLEILE